MKQDAGFRLALAALAIASASRFSPARTADPPAHVDVAPAAARADDIGSIDGIIHAFYDVISGPAGKPREWSRDRSLYIPDVRFVATEKSGGKTAVRVMSHQDFVDRSDASLVREGFDEREIHRVTERFGDIAHVFSTYESRRKAGGPVTARGINSIELFWDGSRWWVACAIWTEARPDLPIPKPYLP